MKLRRNSVALATVIAWIVSAFAHGQQNDLDVVELQGKLEAMSGFQLKVKGEDEQDYTVVLDPAASTFRYLGTASVQYLRPGMLVRFSGEFDQFGNPQAPLQRIEIFTPRQDKLMLEEEIRSQTLGIYPEEVNQPESSDSNPNPPPNQQATNPRGNPEKNRRRPIGQPARKDKPFPGTAAGNVQTFRVVGRLANMQADKIQVVTGVQPLIVQLDPELQISVAAGDASFCQPGDAVAVQGFSRSVQPDWIQAKSILVTGANPLAPPERVLGKINGTGDPSSKKGQVKSGEQTTQPNQRKK